MGVTSIGTTVSASFLASLVEVVEAYTIVLAVGLTRGWRPALSGAAIALVCLAVLVALLGPLLLLVPLAVLQFVVGTLLVLFGLRWLRKAILRATGFIALHDEDKAFARETDALARQAADKRADWIGGMTAFKAVMLEGLEVVFIVVAVGTAHGLTLYASAGALAACILVGLVGVIIHKPLSRVPENTLKFAVGVLLSAFGVFWCGEGIGVDWPGQDLALLYLAVFFLLVALGTVRMVSGRSPDGEVAR
ncbi:COG4280 domain-containing protein [Labrys neptuniae]